MSNKAFSLNPPDRVAVIAPASAPKEALQLKKGLFQLQEAGFTPLIMRSSYSKNGYLAGTDYERVSEFNGLLNPDSPSTLICVRGGYGVLRILDQIDFEAALKCPKLLVGYSDITALQLALYKHAGWAGISGPMVAVEWPTPSESNCEQFLRLASGLDVNEPLNDGPLDILCSGRATGTLLGGNLSLIVRLLGTNHFPDMTGAILFLEDIGEPTYRIDGMFAQLQLAGILSSLGAIVLGGFTDRSEDSGPMPILLNDVFEHYLRPLGIPVAYNLRYGHFPDKVSLPIGVTAELNCSNGRADLVLLESPVKPVSST